MKKDRTGDWCIMKNEEGKRIFDPEENKRIIARYYENLYAKHPVPHHEYHGHIEEQISLLSNQIVETSDIDLVPSKKEIEETIKRKKNKKATTDWENEILKRGGEPMVDLIVPVIAAFWEEETPPKQWNQGLISNVWKGKGDREVMGTRGELQYQVR